MLARKPLIAFPHGDKGDKRNHHKLLWQYVISQGQDLTCLSCQRQRQPINQWGGRQDRRMECNSCRQFKLPIKFSKAAQDAWIARRDNEVRCTACEVGSSSRTPNREMQLYQCQYCPSSCEKKGIWPQNAFEKAKLDAWRDAKQMHLAKCASCVIRLAKWELTSIMWNAAHAKQ